MANGNEHIIVCTNLYGTYIVPRHHNRPVTTCLRNGVAFEPDTIEFMLKNHNNEAIVTAGTYIGDFLPAFCNIPKVFAFEPVSENYKYASLNKILNDLTNTTLEHSCLSDVNNLQRMITSENNIPLGGSSRVISSKYVESSNVKIEEVNSIKLDDYLDKNERVISIIQLDVEGHETQVIQGAIKTIEMYKPIIIVETRPSKDVENQLIVFGYVYHEKTLHGNKILYISGKHNLKF